jgi:hypothetical protein
MEYKFDGRISFDDFMRFHQFNIMFVLKTLFFSIFSKNKMFISLGLLSALIIIISIFVKDHSLQNIIIGIVVLSGPAIAILIIYYSRGLYKKLFIIDKSNIEKCYYTINENIIVIEYKSGIINFTKDNIHRILFDGDSLYIYQEQNKAKIIKKRFFNDENEYKNLLLFIKNEYINK